MFVGEDHLKSQFAAGIFLHRNDYAVLRSGGALEGVYKGAFLLLILWISIQIPGTIFQ